MTTQSTMDNPSTTRETISTRLLIAALGKALVKKGVISHTDVANELSPMIQAVDGRWDAETMAELKMILGTVLDW